MISNIKSAGNLWRCVLMAFAFMLFSCQLFAQSNAKSKKNAIKVLYGQASFYANKFHGRKTASGEIFNQSKYTAACNALPLGTWIKVTNMRNGKSVIVKTNDRLHPKVKRLVDLTRIAAQKLGYISAGLTRVKVEVLPKGKY